MKNGYDGVVALDNKGEAEIKLPDWFSALNKDFAISLLLLELLGQICLLRRNVFCDLSIHYRAKRAVTIM